MTTSVYNGANELLTAESLSGIMTYTYDLAGNQRSVEVPTGEVTTYTFDALNHNTAVELPVGDTVSITWAPVNKANDDRPIERDDGLESIRYVWDDQVILEETDATNVLIARNTAQPGGYGRLLSRTEAGETSFYEFDAIGSTRRLTDGTGTPTDEYSYEAFGKELGGTGSTENPYRWVGEQGYRLDESTGEYNLRARDYDPQAARFTSEDPLGLAAGDSNFYRYVANDPINRSDPSGSWCWTCPIDDIVTTYDSAGRKSISGNPGNVYIGTYLPESNSLARTVIENTRYQVSYSRFLTGLNSGEFSSSWTRREWDQWFRANGTEIRSMPATSCGFNVATMSFDDKFSQALIIAYNEGMIADSAKAIVSEMVKPENLLVTALAIGILASMGAAASAAGGASTALGGPAGAIAAGLGALLVGDLYITWKLAQYQLENAENCDDLREAAPTVADLMVKLAAAGLLQRIFNAAKSFKRKQPGPQPKSLPPEEPNSQTSQKPVESAPEQPCSKMAPKSEELPCNSNTGSGTNAASSGKPNSANAPINNTGATVRVYRVEGTPNTRVLVGENGEIAIVDSNKTLYLNFGDKARAEQYLAQKLSPQQKLGPLPGAEVKSFEVPKSFVDELRASAVTEAQLRDNPALRGRPLVSDPTKTPDSFGLRPEQIECLKKQIIPGSGKTGLE